MKKSRVVITVLVFVIVVLVVIIGYLLKKDTNNEKTLAPKESIALKRYAEELLDPFFEKNDFCGAIFDMYEKDEYEISNMKDEKARAIIRYFKRHQDEYSYYSKDKFEENTGNTISYIRLENLQKIAKLLFAENDFKFPNKFTYNSLKFFELTKYEGEDMLKEIGIGSGCIFIQGMDYYEKIIKEVKEENNKLTIVFDYAFVKYKAKVSESDEEPDIVADIKESTEENAKEYAKEIPEVDVKAEVQRLSDENKLKTYTYTFIEKDGHYVFEKAIRN